MKRNSRMFLSLLCTVGIGLNSNAMEPQEVGNDSMIKNLNNYKKEDFDKFKFGGYRNNQNKPNNGFMIENLNNYPKESFDNFRFANDKNTSGKPKTGFVNSNLGGKNSAKQDMPNINQKAINELNFPKSAFINNDEMAIKLDYPFNLLVVADTEARMRKVASLLYYNNLSYSLGYIMKEQQGLEMYKSGSIFKSANNPNVNILCITLDDFINNNFGYDWDFICQNTTKIFYTFGWDSDNAEKYFDTLKKFYHKFNKHWCGKDLDYNDNYNPYGVTIGTSNFKGSVSKKGRNDWFEYVRVKRNLIDHRYIFFLLDDNENDCTFEFEDYIKRMPDGRSITLFKLNDNINVKSLKDMLFREQYERFQEVQPFTLILNHLSIDEKKNCCLLF